MSSQTIPPTRRKPAVRSVILPAAIVVLLLAMAVSTRIVPVGSDMAGRPDAFSADAYGATEFPKVQSDVEARAVEAPALASAIAQDKAAAARQYGVMSGVGPVMPVKFTGVVGEGRSGIYKVAVEGVPSDVTVRVQTGPAINGTDLRDATGKISFGQFRNQIEYQNAGAALNNAMKTQVLSKADTGALSGKTVAVSGVFKLINPKNWLVTPVRLDVR